MPFILSFSRPGFLTFKDLVLVEAGQVQLRLSLVRCDHVSPAPFVRYSRSICHVPSTASISSNDLKPKIGEKQGALQTLVSKLVLCVTENNLKEGQPLEVSVASSWRFIEVVGVP